MTPPIAGERPEDEEEEEGVEVDGVVVAGVVALLEKGGGRRVSSDLAMKGRKVCSLGVGRDVGAGESVGNVGGIGDEGEITALV